MSTSYAIEYIGAAWCFTCKVIKPKTEELAKKFNVPLNCRDYDKDLSEEEQSEIKKVPTLRIFKNREKVAEYSMRQVELLEVWLQGNVSLTTDDF